MTSPRSIVFLGPTLDIEASTTLLDAEFRPPAKRGDVVLAVRDGASRIGLIDGCFCEVPAVAHKEIMWALDRGVQVWGAASLGALRAAELADYGMIGVGRIFEDYRAGILTDDDEVAIQHGPKELHYVATSEAMVNIRATVSAARHARILQGSAQAVLAHAKARHYPERVWPDILRDALLAGADCHEIERFAAWLPTGIVDLKRWDAVLLLERMAEYGGGEISPIYTRRVKSRLTEYLAAILEQNGIEPVGNCCAD